MSIGTLTKKSIMVLGLLTLTGCSNLTPQEQRMVTGAAAGTAVGALGTVLMGGCVSCGAAIGGAAGTGLGYLVEQMQDDETSSPPAVDETSYSSEW